MWTWNDSEVETFAGILHRSDGSSSMVTIERNGQVGLFKIMLLTDTGPKAVFWAYKYVENDSCRGASASHSPRSSSEAALQGLASARVQPTAP